MGTHTLRSLLASRGQYISPLLSAAPPTLSCQIKFIGGTTPTTKRRVWREAELKKVTKNEETVESARDHREVLEYFIAPPREFRPRSIVFCFVPHSPNPSSSARMCAGEGHAGAAATGDCRNKTLCQEYCNIWLRYCTRELWQLRIL